jgi:hypothetical protein
VITSPVASAIVRFMVWAIGIRASTARASSVVLQVSRRYRITIGTPNPSPIDARPPNVRDTASPASFMPSHSPQTASVVPITVRLVNLLRRITASINSAG